MSGHETDFSDADLTGYLDGALDADLAAAIDAALARDSDLAARLAALDIPLADVRAAMDPDLLAVPPLPDHLRMNAQEEPGTPRRAAWLMPVAIAAAFAAGVIVTPFLRPPPSPLPVAKEGGWIDTIASYQSLYVPETLATAMPDAFETSAVLAQAQAALGVQMAPATQVAEMQFKRAQMLGYKGRPLLQMAYLSADGTPFALCVTTVSGEDRGAKTTQSHGLIGVSWVENGLGYLLIGGTDARAVEVLSEQVQAVI
ncbi:hypothetical protein [Sulfitobacter sp. JB4-11]|uniref:hypothetical protein n=1 Tax=Sulfitobacter rhodophyticola TaxID=3238304 RepID=UPI003512F9D4